MVRTARKLTNILGLSKDFCHTDRGLPSIEEGEDGEDLVDGEEVEESDKIWFFCHADL